MGPKKTKTETETTTPVESAPQPRSRKAFNWPTPTDPAKSHRAGTKRALVVELLGRPEGATFEEVQEAIAGKFGADAAWDDRTCYEGIKLIHSSLGYGLSQDADGRIRLQTPKSA